MKAVITGATRGIGKAISYKLAKEGFDLVLMARNEADLVLCKQDLESKSCKVDILAIDLSNKSALEALSQNSILFENITVLINNLGVFSVQKSDQLDITVLQKQIEINLYSAINLTQLVLPQFRKKEKGTIVNIGSRMSLDANAFASDYSISKHAFKAWNDSLREKLRTENIKVSAIYPGSVNTSSWDGIKANRKEMIQPIDVAEIVFNILKMSPNALIEEVRVEPRNFEI